MSGFYSSSVISRENKDLEGDLDQEYGLIQEFTSEVGATNIQVQDNQATNQNISPSGLIIETESRFEIEIESEQKESQETSPSDSTSESTSGGFTIAMLGAKGYFDLRGLSRRSSNVG